MKPIYAWILSVAVASPLFSVARSTNLFLEGKAPVLYTLFVLAFLAPWFVGLLAPFKAWRYAIPTVLGVLAGDICAIFRDLAKDSTSHNIWQMEVTLLTLVVTVCGVSGALTGGQMARSYAKWLASIDKSETTPQIAAVESTDELAA